MSEIRIGKKLDEKTILNMKKSNRSKEVSGVKVNMFCFYTNDLLNSFDSISDASKFIERPISCISNNISNRSNYTTIKKTNNKVIFKKI